MKITSESGAPINSVEEWFLHAPPKRGHLQWKDGRSAKELARAWFRTSEPACPAELSSLLLTHPSTRELALLSGMPEMKIPLDNFRGETRNSDMVLLGEVKGRPAVIAIEAKADEEFGMTIADRLKDCSASSNVPVRISQLCSLVFGHASVSEIAHLRYQLLHAFGATIIEAKRNSAPLAVFVVHEFISDSLEAEKLERNAEDFAAFATALTGWDVEKGQLYTSKGADYGMQVLIGKTTAKTDGMFDGRR